MARILRCSLSYMEILQVGVISEFGFAVAREKRTKGESVPRDLHFTVLTRSATLDLVSL